MSVRRNLFANYAGSGWTALMGLVFVPIYLRFVGAEGYGLVGFYALLASAMAILDGGLGSAATREAAAFHSAEHEGRRDIVTLLRTLEVVFWSIAVVAGACAIAAAPWIAAEWLRVPPQRLATTTTALRLMGASLLVNFPIAFYSAALNGLQSQVQLNAINAASATLRGVGAVLVLWLVSPTIEAFFAWQCVASLCTAVALRSVLWAATGTAPEAGRFDTAALRRVGRFAGGVATVNVLSLLVTQMDKIVLSKLLPLEQLGYYTLAWTLATVAYRLIGPVFNAYYPRLTELVAQSNAPAAQREYLGACRLMALAVVPYCLWLAFFGGPLLDLWTRNSEVARAAAVAVGLLSLGTMCNGFMTMPYALQLAHGWTSLALWQNIVAVLALGPMIYFMCQRYGLTGAAAPWLIVNASYVIIGIHFMVRRLRLPAVGMWYIQAIIAPVLLAGAVLLGFWLVQRELGELPVLAALVMIVALPAAAGVNYVAMRRPQI